MSVAARLASRATATSDLWWKNAVVYCLDVETFQDSDGDGVGDLAGLTERVDYLAGLGVTCIWLMPFFPTPDLDDGYDVSDYYAVDPRLGSLGDFVEFVRTARDRGLRVIADLVVNHTSDQHPWFLSARASRSSPYRDFYVWREERPREEPDDMVFPDEEKSVWRFDEEAGCYYLHRFYRHQPDLNVANPRVRDEIHKIMGFWLELGVSGFRVDAVPYLLEMSEIQEDPPDDRHAYLRDLRAFLSRRRGDGLLLGEVNLAPQVQRRYFGDEEGDEMQMLFAFTVNQTLYLSLARGDAEPLKRALAERPEIPLACQWANFVRNHDELTLDKLSKEERAEVFAAFAPDEEMRIFRRGIRRRLPPMLAGDERRLRLVYSLLFSLPGTPVLLYGEEIGMGDNLKAEGRMSVRTPMQWSDAENGGFSTARQGELCVPPVDDRAFTFERVNVADQRHDPDSLLNWTERVIRMRKECPEIGWGSSHLLDTGRKEVLGHRCDWSGGTVIALHNFSPHAQHVTVAASDRERHLLDLFTGHHIVPSAAGFDVELPAYGYRWLRAS